MLFFHKCCRPLYRGFPLNQRDSFSLSMTKAMPRLPASTNATETKVYDMAVGSKAKNGTNVFVIIVKMGEKSSIASVLAPMKCVAVFTLLPR